MSDLKHCEQGSVTCEMKKSSVLTKEDFRVLVTAGLLFMLGTAISIGGCALRVREERQKDNAKKAGEVFAQEQKDQSSVLQAPLIREKMSRRKQKILDK